MISAVEAIAAIDDKLSKRFLELDPAGYFIIYLDREAGLICAKHFSNEVNEQGLAVDPETGKPIPATVRVERQATTLFTGRTAKEICVQLFESTKTSSVSRFDHAAYLGRELMRAELALVTGQDYVQD